MYDLERLIDYTPKKNSLRGRNILVTGAGDGIGKAAALAYSRHGATVILLGRSDEKLEATYDAIEAEKGPQAAITPLDLETADDASFQQLGEEIHNNIGPLHGLLHNASILGTMQPLEQTTTDDWERLQKINVTSAFAMTKALLPNLRAADTASLVFTSSGVGRKGRAYWGAYATSKFATEGLVQVWADELTNTTNIRTNSLNPGATRTAMRQQAYPGENPTSLPAPDTIMGAYLFLMGDDSLSINGQQLDAQAPR